METSQIVVQIFANVGISAVLFFVITRQINRRDTAFDKMVDLLNGLLRRQDVSENNLTYMKKEQDRQAEDIKEIRRYKVEYKP